MTFKHKPTTAEAVQFAFEDGVTFVLSPKTDVVPGWLSHAFMAGILKNNGGHLAISTPVSHQTASEGWVVKPQDGAIYICDVDSFATNYEAVKG